MVTSRKIPPPNAPSEEGITTNEHRFLFKQDTEASRAMTRYMQQPTRLAKEAEGALLRGFIDGDRFNFNSEPPFSEKVPVRHHGHRQFMGHNPASVAFFDSRRIRHMVKMPVGQKENLDLPVGKSLIRALGCIKQNPALFRMKKDRIGIERTPGKS